MANTVACVREFLFIAFICCCLAFVAQGQCLDHAVAVSVKGYDGRPVTDLHAADFRANGSGNSIEIVSVKYERSPRRLVILMDTSGSVTGSTWVWNAYLETAVELIKSLPPNVSVAVLTFAGESTVVANFDDSRATVLQKLAPLATVNWKKVKGTGKTALLDALARALTLLAPGEPGDSILALTDGGENASMEREPPLERGILGSGVRVFGIIGFARNPAAQLQILPQALTSWELRQVPDAIAITGGDYLAFRWELTGYAAAHLRESVRALSARLLMNVAASYRIQVRTKQPIDHPIRWTLEIDSSKRPEKLTVLYPHKLAPCK